MKTYIELTCDYCRNQFKRLTTNHNQNIKRNNKKNIFCSINCYNEYQSQNNCVFATCHTCNKPLKILNNKFNKSKTKRFYCNHSCSATYTNKLKRKSRRSKIEAKFYDMLVKEFPDLNILANDKTMLDGLEADIAIPTLKLAIEWNGIVHFKPIYGQTKLDKIQDKDAEKLKIASDKNINLIVIPDLVSNDKILNQAFNDVKNIINNLIKKCKG